MSRFLPKKSKLGSLLSGTEQRGLLWVYEANSCRTRRNSLEESLVVQGGLDKAKPLLFVSYNRSMNNTITLQDVLAKANWSESDITKVYVGKSHCCRCGCQGDYFKRGESEFEKALNELRKGIDLVHDFGPDDIGSNYINVDTDEVEDTCICLYND